MKDQQNNDKLMKENEKLKEEMAKKDQQIGIMKEEITKLQEENQGLKEQMAKIKNSGKRQKSSICRRPLPAELMNELFTSLSLENALGLLTKMPNGLLARNVQKMLNDIKTKMKSNKWNMADCGPKLAISDDGFVVEHSGSNVLNCVRAIWPIPTFNFCATTKKPLIIFYYEVEILMKQWIYGITIGFNTRQFPLEGNWRGKAKNSFGFNCKRIMWWFDESNKFENATRGYFAKGDIIGIGIIHSWANSSMQMQYFSTCNGELLGKVELPAKFAKIKLFPAVTLFNTGESIRANFGKEKFCFKDFDKLLQ